MPWFVYILECSDRSYYVGYTSNLEDRLQRHNSGRGPAYTAKRRPVKMIYSDPHDSRKTAAAREKQIKKWSRGKKEALINGDIEMLHRLSRRRGGAKGHDKETKP